jgi:hypothetical protein
MVPIQKVQEANSWAGFSLYNLIQARTLGVCDNDNPWLIIHGIVNFLLLFQVSKKYKL